MPTQRTLERRDKKDPAFKIPWIPERGIVTAENQAGGGNVYADDTMIEVSEFNSVCDRYLSTMYDDLSRHYDMRTEAGIKAWLLGMQGETQDRLSEQLEELNPHNPSPYFLYWMHSEYADAHLDDKPADDQWDHPFNNYYISSSHNTYLTGNQLYGQSNTDGYKNVLRRGCRCVEIDVWNGDDSASDSSLDKEEIQKGKGKAKAADAHEILVKPTPWKLRPAVEPVVLHGYTATRRVPFRRVCETIRDNAFAFSKHPVIVSLEVHANHENQESMVEIMKHCFQGLLLEPPDADSQSAKDAASRPLPSPNDLSEKILIKVKYTPPKTEAPEPKAPIPDRLAGIRSPADFPTNTNISSPETSEDEATKVHRPTQGEKFGKIIPSLSAMGIYTRSCHFKSFMQPEAQVHTHIFSLSEGKLAEEHENSPEAVFEHNKSFLMRVFPRGTRITSSNLDPSIFWRLGAQMVALNWQRFDAAMMLNEALFMSSGGYVLKPEGYRAASLFRTQSGITKTYDCSCISIEFFAGQGIPIPDGTVPEKFRPYVKVELHVESPSMEEIRKNPDAAQIKDGGWKQSTKSARSFDRPQEDEPEKRSDPDFARQILTFNGVPPFIASLSFIRFKVMHDARLGRDDLAAWACIRLDRLGQGYRILHLFDAKGVQTEAFLLIRVDMGTAPTGGLSVVQSESSSRPAHGGMFAKVKDRLMGEHD